MRAIVCFFEYITSQKNYHSVAKKVPILGNIKKKY